MENALSQLLLQLCERDAFNTLRTKEQLGYIVWAFRECPFNVNSLSFVIQSNSFSIQYLASRVDSFINNLLSEILISKLREDSNEFEEAVEELSKTKLEKLKSLGSLADRVYDEINKGTLIWNRHIEEVGALRQLTRDQLLRFAFRVLQVETRRLIVGVCGKKEVDSAGAAADRERHARNAALSLSEAQNGKAHIVDSVAKFKTGLSLYPSA